MTGPEPGPQREHRPLHDWWMAFAIVAAVAGIIWGWTAQYASECSNALIGGADSSCGMVTAVHDISGGTALVFAVLFVVALVA